MLVIVLSPNADTFLTDRQKFIETRGGNMIRNVYFRRRPKKILIFFYLSGHHIFEVFCS